ncbi:uncharacterized protein L3040_000065 [Drepanopeziza brunnea f. sp. 'multigermtubi']|uniref:SH3 domain-containing protein n=1 Tax=Marssonina brunnea f. sp. multigermtubi (strain MB_m1) TaxID=1072389 RepID=K1WQ79_MARBU|nr:SH3 domain-containing protein [Drepanopeziza brunnea f. sp. 'multigermtubi' MB_m1]EKD14542.1 SH3 domain-containing protein [Drepanopeziza brunnea f. sp. 'multigermtubi' MB_m1]KAJ5053774.1 hypothetical protein L3040_000065 [Drepanopeziza brunnea f. sp. 'multigermtubi']
MYKQDSLKPSPLNPNRDAPNSLGREDTGGNESDASDSSSGLGINFYDNRRGGRRSVCYDKEEAEQKDYQGIAAVSQVKGPPQGAARRPSGERAKPTHDHLLNPPSASTLLQQTPRLANFAAKLIPELGKPSSVLLDELIEENLRGQAEDFVRIASRATPVRALSTAGVHSPRSASRRSVSAPVAQGLGLDVLSGGGGGVVQFMDDDVETLHFQTSRGIIETAPLAPLFESPSSANPTFESTSTSTSTSKSTSTSTTQTQIRKLSANWSSSPHIGSVTGPRYRIQSARELSGKRLGGGAGSGFSPHSSTTKIKNRSSSTSSSSYISNSPSGQGLAIGIPAPAFKNKLRIPIHSKPSPVQVQKRPDRSSEHRNRGPEWFSPEERLAITELVFASKLSCEHHVNCRTCIEQQYSYYENNALPPTMDPDQRQKIINRNRSLRNIKNELEALAETGAISDEAYDAIMSHLPQESSLNRAASTQAEAQAPAPVPAPTPSPVPTAAFNALQVSADPPPPAYTTPALPSREPSAPPPKPKPEIARATALYRYTEPSDCNFEPGDQIAVHEYMNADWWLGRNLRTGKEGVFPVNYVQVLPAQQQQNMNPYGGAYPNEKMGGGGYPGQYNQHQPQQMGPPPGAGPSNPYDSSVPPMAIAEQPSDGGKQPGNKGSEMGKKFGKKLGNAAIFGAGATIGGNIVNSIF